MLASLMIAHGSFILFLGRKTVTITAQSQFVTDFWIQSLHVGKWYIILLISKFAIPAFLVRTLSLALLANSFKKTLTA